MRHKFLVLTVKKWLKSVYIYGSYRKIKTGVPLFLDHSVYTNRQLRSPFTNGGGNVSDVRPNLFLIGGGTNPANTKAKCPSEA